MRGKRIITALACVMMAVCLMQTAVYAAPPRRRVTVKVTAQSENQTTPEVDFTDLTQSITIRNASTGEYITDSIYNVLCMVVEAEVGSGFEKEAIKAQAIATHSYLLYHAERGATVSCPIKTPKARVKECVAEVVNKVIYYDGKVIEAVYAASSGGGTQSSKDYWGGEIPYLQAASCPYDIEGQEHVRTLDLEYVREWFPGCNFPEDPHQWFEILSTNQNGFALQIRAGDQIISGHDFTSYDHIWMRSCKFIGITYNESDNTFTFATVGRGHGVGLSQIGANGFAKYEGWDHIRILTHFYTGVTVADYRGM